MTAPVLVRNDSANDNLSIFQNRTLAQLSDGSLLVAIYDDSANQWIISHTPDRVTFTPKITITGVTGSCFSMVVEDAGDHIQVVYSNAATHDTNLVWARYLKTAGPTWTITGSVETIVTGGGSDIFAACDIDVLGVAGACTVIYKSHEAGFGTHELVSVRSRGSGGSWSAIAQLTALSTSSDYPYDPVSVSADPGGPSGATQRVILCGCANSIATSGQRVWIATALINTTTGALTSAVYSTSTYATMNSTAGTGSMHKIQSFRGEAAGQWYFIVSWYSTLTTGYVSCDYITWNGSALVTTSGVVGTIQCDWAFWSRVGIDMVALGSAFKKAAIFSRSGSQAVACNVYDYNTGLWSGSFGFVSSAPAPTLLASGATRDFINNAVDILFNDTANGDTYLDYNQTPPVPASTTPAAGVTVTTDTPTVGVTFNAAQSGSYRRKARFTIANDSGFTTNVKTFDESDADLDSTGSHTEVVSVANQLTQGTRYIKSATMDAFGKASAYMTSHSFVVAHPPNAINLVPSGGEARDFAGTGITSADWDFSDTSPVDFQTAYQVIVERNDTGASIYDSGKITSAATIANMTIPSANKDMLLRWKVIVWDSDDVQGPASAYAYFYIGSVPVVNVTAPAEAGTATSPTPAVTWTFTAGGTRTQVSYRVVIKENFAPFRVVYDSGVVAGAGLTHTPPSPVLANTTNYTVTVTATDSYGLSGSDSNNFASSWSAPSNPTATYDVSGFNDLGYINVSWTNAAKDATFSAWRVYRRESSPTTPWILLYETLTDQSTYNFHDWFAESGMAYDYIVVQVALRFGVQVEGVYTGFTTVTPSGTDYWLIHPADETFNCRLSQVTGEDFTDEIEEAELLIIGRGRKKDYGTRWGYKGTLTCEVWDRTDKTARQQRMALEALKLEMRDVYLRNPFGDFWLVTMGAAQIGRIVGVGQREFHNLTLPYSEVS